MVFAPVVIIHANPTVAVKIRRWLSQAGYDSKLLTNLMAAQLDRDRNGYALLIADEFAKSKNGQPFYETLKTTTYSVPVILLSENPSIQRAIEAIKVGVNDYLPMPVEEKLLLAAVTKSLSVPEPQQKRERDPDSDQPILITQATGMLDLLSVAQRVAESSATVLIQGESGTGKELLARYIHINSDRKDKPFVAMNCAALPENLAESELFGYEKGAFTGASKTRLGKFEQANNGTLLLDEISEMPLTMQAKLLRVLQEKEVDHLGGGQPISVNVRCIATSNQDLQKMVKEGRFRQDLYFRLRVIPLTIPPLRERKDDIPLLLTHFIGKFKPGHTGNVYRFDDTALASMLQWQWPGNVRELENTVERALLISKGPTLSKASLLLDSDFNETEDSPSNGIVGMTVKEIEKKLIGQTLSHLNHNRTHAAKMLGISIRTLRNKLREYQENEDGATKSMHGK